MELRFGIHFLYSKLHAFGSFNRWRNRRLNDMIDYWIVW